MKHFEQFLNVGKSAMVQPISRPMVLEINTDVIRPKLTAFDPCRAKNQIHRSPLFNHTTGSGPEVCRPLMVVLLDREVKKILRRPVDCICRMLDLVNSMTTAAREKSGRPGMVSCPN